MGIDLIHFGLVMAVNLTIGMCTPPLGVCLFVSGSIAKVSLKDQMRDLLPMYLHKISIKNRTPLSSGERRLLSVQILAFLEKTFS